MGEGAIGGRETKTVNIPVPSLHPAVFNPDKDAWEVPLENTSSWWVAPRAICR
jgi:hypothetical protein